jgi:hypothetical protein
MKFYVVVVLFLIALGVGVVAVNTQKVEASKPTLTEFILQQDSISSHN